MRIPFVILSLLLTAVVASGGQRKSLHCASDDFYPRIGQVSFDIYWINESVASRSRFQRSSDTALRFHPSLGQRPSDWMVAPSIISVRIAASQVGR